MTLSWSWASLDTPFIITHDNHSIDRLAKILGAAVQHRKQSQPYGTVDGGHIKIKGPMLRAEVRRVKRSRTEEWIVLLADDSGSGLESSKREYSEVDLEDLRSTGSETIRERNQMNQSLKLYPAKLKTRRKVHN
jgi:hypothetical protein